MKRTIAMILLVALLALPACGGGGGSGSNAASTGELSSQCQPGALQAAAKPVQITMWHAMTRANEDTLKKLTDEFNASQSDVVVSLVNQTSYEDVLTKFKASLGGGQLPDLMQIQDVDQQLVVDSGALVPAQACVDALHVDQSPVLPKILDYYTIKGVQWAMPFSVSNPILYFNKNSFAKAGLDPNNPPRTLDELRAASQKIVASGANKYGMALKLDPWYLEMWHAMAGDLYADHDNGRTDRAGKVLFDGQQGQDIVQWLSGMAKDGLAEGTPVGGFDNLFAVGNNVAGMTLDTSAALGTAVALKASGAWPDADLGAAPLPGPVPGGGTIVAGSALYLLKASSPEKREAAFRFASFLDSAQSQSKWAAGTGYVPIRTDATTLAPLTDVYAQYPEFRIAFDQLQRGDRTPATAGPVIGAMEPVRAAVVHAEETIFQGGDPVAALHDAANAANAAVADYESRVTG